MMKLSNKQLDGRTLYLGAPVKEFWPIIAGAIAAIGGGVASWYNSEADRENAQQLTEDTNKTNYLIAQENREWQEEMIDKQNAYNSPVEQKKRLEDAGINPYLALSNNQSVSGNQTHVPSQSPPVMQSGVEALTQIAVAQNQSLVSMINNVGQNAAALADSASKQMQTSKTKVERDFAKAAFTSQLEQIDKSNRLTEAKITETEWSGRMMQIETLIQETYGGAIKDAELGRVLQETVKLFSDNSVNESIVNLNKEKRNSEVINQANTIIDTALKKMDIKEKQFNIRYKMAMLPAVISQLTSQAEYYSAQAHQSKELTGYLATELQSRSLLNISQEEINQRVASLTEEQIELVQANTVLARKTGDVTYLKAVADILKSVGAVIPKP